MSRPAHGTRAKWIALGAGALLLGGTELRYHALSRLAALIDPDQVESWLAAAGPLAPVFYIALMAAAVVSPLATIPLDLVAGRFFGPLAGTFYSVLGATLGSLVSFAVARWLGRDFVSRFLSGHIHFCERCSDRLLGKVVFVARLLPIAPFDLVSYGAGLTRMSALRFAAASFLGMIPLTYVYNAAGDIILADRRLAWVAGAALTALFFLLPWWIERYDPFAMRRYFRHDEPEALQEVPDAAKAPGARE